MHRGYRSAVYSLESPQIFFVIYRIFSNQMQILPSKLKYSNSPLEIPCADSGALGHVCREKYKILPSNVKFSRQISDMQIL